MGSIGLHYRRPMTMAEALKLPAAKRATMQHVALARAQYAILKATGRLHEDDVQDTEPTE